MPAGHIWALPGCFVKIIRSAWGDRHFPRSRRKEQAIQRSFHDFFERHHQELARLGYLLTGDPDAADDLAADALFEAWRGWARIRHADSPIAYVRRILVNLAGDRIKALIRDRGRLEALGPFLMDRTDGPDVAAVIDMREALQCLPLRKRACVVLRHAFDLSERETAEILGISVGTVKSQTSKGVAELERLLGGGLAPVGVPGAGQGRGEEPAPGARAPFR